MRISSKSIMSPGRAGVRTPATTLSTSLSRRLRTSGSIRGGASPAMFPTSAKKRGSFENPEPSSPKVTCIGQVRVRSRKKQAKKVRNLSKRRSSGEVSFRNLDHSLNGFPSKRHKHKESSNLGSNGAQNQHRNQNQESVPKSRWVHFPVTICDSLKAFGSEFSCLFPCRTERGDGSGERGIKLVVGDEEEEKESVLKTRRHVFEDLEIVNDRIEGHKDEARVSVCVPPKNALLLMRCRSDPMKIEALTNRSWEPNVVKTDEEDEFVDNEDGIEEDLESLEVEHKQVMILDQDQENVQFKGNQDQENVQFEANQYQEDNVQQDEANEDQEHKSVQQDETNQDQEHLVVQEDKANQDQEHDNLQQDEANQDQEHDNVQQDEMGQYQEYNIVQQDEPNQDQEHYNLQQFEVGQDQDHNQTEESFNLVSLFEEIVNQDYEIQEQDEAHKEDDVIKIVTEFAEIAETHEQEMVNEAEEHNNKVFERESEVKDEKESEKVLPECLLMMMYEPKLSMEVSKETWVCQTDFIQRQPSRKKPPAPVKPDDGGDESSVGATATVDDELRVAESGPPTVLRQPARSSCSLPAAPSMAVVLEQKLENAVGYEPLVLTRCKTEPMKTAASKLQPESCVLENRKLERLSRVASSVGAAGLGF